MRRKRRKFSTEFKLKVILECLKERSTLTELAQKHELHPNQISKWKTDFLANATRFMSKSSGGKETEDAAEIEELFAKIGRLQMEVDFLKKKLC